MALKFANNQSLTSTTALPSAVPTDNLILISTQTASSSATISFTTGLDSTYDEYQFHFINMHPATNNTDFTFNFSTDSGSNYNVTKTSSFFRAYHNEAGTVTSLEYVDNRDAEQSTGFHSLTNLNGNQADSGASGSITIFNPSSTTYVKHFIASSNCFDADPYLLTSYLAGYANTTSAINAIQFKFASGNIDDGIIKMYGVKKS